MLSTVRSSSRRARHLPAVLAGAIVVSSALVAAGGPLAAPAGAALPQRVGLPALAPAGALALGALAPSTAMQVDVVLQPRDPSALAAYATAVSTPGSTLYRRYLPAGSFPRVFGPLPTTIAAVESWLRGRGLRPAPVDANRLYIEVNATAAQLEKAFSIGLERYELGGRVAYANTAAPLFGAAVAKAISGVVGLESLVVPQHMSILTMRSKVRPHVTPHVVTGGPQPCSAASLAGDFYSSYTSDQLAAAYKFSSLYGASDFGAGQTVALFELEPNLKTDISAFQSCYGTSAKVSYIKVDKGAGTGAGQGEAALDIEDVIGFAPKAAVDVYEAPNTNTGLYEDYSDIVKQDKAKVISTSWGECEAESSATVLKEENTLFEQAATQGQSVFAAAGDSGSEDCGKDALGVDDPASQPYVTGVGGTKLTAIGPPPTQVVWNEGALGGAGGGGISEKWAMPTYQSGAPKSLNVINSDSSGTPCKAASGSYCREVPDVSADADPFTGFVIYYDGAWMGIGGTSDAAPLWAAFTALTNASSGCGGKAIGFANPVLYKVAGSSSYATSFSDITSGNNDETGTNGGKFPAGKGYDMASGLGTPIASGLAPALCKA
jgi:subtilase family serine protease